MFLFVSFFLNPYVMYFFPLQIIDDTIGPPLLYSVQRDRPPGFFDRFFGFLFFRPKIGTPETKYY